LFDRFMSQVPGCRTKLREMVAETGGPELDCSLRSLEPVCQWVLDWVKREPDDGEDWLSIWFNRDAPRVHEVDNGHLVYKNWYLSPQADRMRQRLAVYVSDVMMRLVPRSRWVCWRGNFVGDHPAGDILLDVGDPNRPFQPRAADGLVFTHAYTAGFDPSHPEYRAPNPREATDYVDQTLARLEERRRKGLEPVFQAAPTGREAAKGRTPHAGRREFNRGI
jgi:hypothetical protein